MSALTEANNAAVLSAGQNPKWKVQSAFSAIPTISTSGVDVSGALRSQIELALRRKAHTRSAVLLPVIFDAATTYNAIISGTTVGATGADLDAMLVALAIAINADAAAKLVVLATAVDSTNTANAGSNTQLLIEGLAEADWYFDFSVAAGTGTATGSADAVTAVLNVYVLGGGSNTVNPPSGRWVKVNNLVDRNIDSGGFIERLDVAGHSRCAVHAVLTGLATDGASVTFDAQAYHGTTV